MMSHEIERWSKDWQNLKSDMSGIVKELKKARRRAWLDLISGWLACLFLIVLGITSLIFVSRAAVYIFFSLFMLIFGLAAGLWMTKIFLQSRRSIQSATTTYLDEMRHRTEADLRMARTRWPFAAVAIFGAIWMPWWIYFHRDIYEKRPWSAVTGVVLFILILGFTWRVQRRRAKQAQAKLDALNHLEAELREETARDHPPEVPTGSLS